LLAAKYPPPASTQTLATTANFFFIVSIPITFDQQMVSNMGRDCGAAPKLNLGKLLPAAN
jgi:hypothetical protein